MMKLGLRSQMCLILLVSLCAVTFNTVTCCHEKDRSLLLKFKEGVIDPSNRLSSWSSLYPHCCQWEGVLCHRNNRVFFLDLSSNNHSESLGGEINLSSLLELQFLGILSLDSNDFERISLPSSINTSAATRAHLLPNSSSKLSVLTLSYNIHLRMDNLHHFLSLLPSLAQLDLSGIHLPTETNWVQSLASLPLDELYLYDCNLTSSIMSLEYSNFSSLSILDLGLNDFRYGLPNWLFNQSEYLSLLHLSQCNLRGPILDLSGYQNLRSLDLSNNKFKGPVPDWFGQLGMLGSLNLSNNFFHGSIPFNLRNLSFLSKLDLSFNNLSGENPKILEHNWFGILDLSHNSIGGDISELLLTNPVIYMSFNKFEGRLPRISENVIVLDLSHNSFSGSLSSLLCSNETKYYDLAYLDLSNNLLTEELPDCWSSWANLSYIYLGINKLSGAINPTMGSSVTQLRSLDLQDNSFYGQVPSTFKNCTSLVLINLEGNNFSGTIPKWMPQSVSIVKVRSNHFVGHIPTQLCTLSHLILLDLANNKLSGPIPLCLHNLTLMNSGPSSILYLEKGIHGWEVDKIPYIYRSFVHTKGQELRYDKYLDLVRSIDLSANELSGEIPAQLLSLDKLQSLNLSYNYLRGEISEQIREMRDLESLDLSHNNLSGNIPRSMSGLSFLSVLNLSYNHFSGQIPLGTQLQSFDAWSYTGNPELCGAPLQKNCPIPEKPDITEEVEGNDDDDAFLKSLYLGVGIGFAVGFWMVCGSLFLNRAWRHAYFRFFDGVVDRIYVAVAIKLRRFR